VIVQVYFAPSPALATEAVLPVDSEQTDSGAVMRQSGLGLTATSVLVLLVQPSLLVTVKL